MTVYLNGLATTPLSDQGPGASATRSGAASGSVRRKGSLPVEGMESVCADLLPSAIHREGFPEPRRVHVSAFDQVDGFASFLRRRVFEELAAACANQEPVFHGSVDRRADARSLARHLTQAWSVTWNVYARAPLNGSAVITRYLSRHIHRIAIFDAGIPDRDGGCRTSAPERKNHQRHPEDPVAVHIPQRFTHAHHAEAVTRRHQLPGAGPSCDVTMSSETCDRSGTLPPAGNRHVTHMAALRLGVHPSTHTRLLPTRYFMDPVCPDLLAIDLTSLTS